MAVKWTAEQSAAINTRNKTLLISASAGSGKTAVLTERIITRLCDTNAPGELSRMLIVTFTKAAANELKSRIAKALEKACENDPKNRHLRRQLLLSSSASISTIHSFCLDIIKKNLKKLGLPEGISVANDTEISLLRRDVLNELINNVYNGVSDIDFEDFGKLCDMLSERGSDFLIDDTLLDCYDKLLSLPEGLNFLKIHGELTLSEASLDFFDTEHGKTILSHLGENTKYIAKKYKSLEADLMEDGVVKAAYAPVFYEDLDFLSAIGDCLVKNDYSLARAYFEAYTPSRLKPLARGYTSEVGENFKAVREAHKKHLRDELKPLFCMDSEENKHQRELSGKLELCLYSLLCEFDKAFKKEKARLSKLDFNDIERYAYDLLVKDGEKSEYAKRLSEEFDEIYIDEYQDTNSVQDAIFKAISTPTNRFMVGDVKQSIYSFRGAAPENFQAYRESFKELSQNCGDCAKIFLQNNFRCDKSVVDFSNAVFSVIMNNTGKKQGYLDSDNLVCSKLNGDTNVTKAHLVLAKREGEDSVCEAKYIASEILRLTKNECKKDKTPISYGDITILVRAKQTSIGIEKALKELGIPTSNSVETEFFENPEILLVLSLLNVIDNPLRDIYLAGVLKSPLFDFSLEELVKIRAHKQECTLYEALVSYSEDENFEKGKVFLERLDYFRSLAEGERVDNLIKRLYGESSLFTITAHNKKNVRTAAASRENLLLLYTYARDFEGSQNKGLESFISYINDIIARKTKLAGESSKSFAASCVKIMTIHHAKGLEFPVVFLAGAGKLADISDNSNALLIDAQAGVSLDIPGVIPGARIHSPCKRALTIALDEKRYSEEMRVLYVALTRARERLYVTGDFKEPEKEISAARERARELCPAVLMKRLSYMQLILTALESKNCTKSDFCTLVYPESTKDFCENEVNTAVASDEKLMELAQTINKRINFVYPYKTDDLPAKMSVSQLSEAALDAIVSTETMSERKDALVRKMDEYIPEFTGAQKKADSASRGSATHKFMQFCDYELCALNGAKIEAERLVKLAFLTQNDACLVDFSPVDAFFKSDFYNNVLRHAKNLKREFRFNADMPASMFTSDKSAYENESVLVQGIIDCFFENSDGTLTVLDYKTDHVPQEMKNDIKAFKKLLISRHCTQLSYYKYALEALSCKKVSSTLIYSFALSDVIEVKL